MKRLTLLLALLLTGAVNVSATVRYVAQNAGVFGGGTNCNGQTAITPATWNATAESAGDVSWVCGTITFGLNTNGLIFGWSGSSGNPITLNFDTGAILQSPAFKSSGGGTVAGGISFGSGLSWIVVDGKNTGTVQNTDNGTSLTNQQLSTGVSGFGCSNCTLKNLTIANIYVSVEGNLGGIDNTLVRGFDLSGVNWTISGNTIHDFGWNMGGYSNNDTNYNIFNNDISHMSHAWAPSASSARACLAPCFFFHDNHVHDTKNWDGYIPPAAFNCPSHGDGIHAFGVTGSTMDGLYIYNNLFDGDWGACMTGFIFIEGVANANASNVYLWNNVFDASGTTLNVNTQGWVGVFGVVSGVIQGYNNTCIGTGATDQTLCYAPTPSVTTTATITWENNVTNGIGNPVSIGTNGTIGTWDHNFYGTVPCVSSSPNQCWKWHGTNQGSFSAWKTACSCDTNSVQNSSPLLNADGSPQAGSPVIHNGTTNFLNLTATATGNLASLQNDTTKGNSRTANARPNSSTFNWDAGAYQFVAASPSPSPGGGFQISAVPLPNTTVTQPTITSVSPTKTYVTKSGCSQDGVKWLNPCSFRVFCNNCGGGTVLSLDGVQVTQAFVGSEMDATVSLSVLPVPSQITVHSFTATNPAVAVPVLQ